MDDMIFNHLEIKLLGEFYEHLVVLKELKEEESGGADNWTCRKWTFEVLEQLIKGDEAYTSAVYPDYLLPHPRYRADHWKLWYGRRKRIMLEELRGLRDQFDHLFIPECGYGVDGVLAMMVKDWAEIEFLDTNKYLEEGIVDFFKTKHGCNIKFTVDSSHSFHYDQVDKKTILIANNTHIDASFCGAKINSNDNLYVLHNGVHLDPVPETQDECYKIDAEININRGII